MDLTVFLTVFDYNLYDPINKVFTDDKSQMEYDIYIGAQPDANTPGHSG